MTAKRFVVEKYSVRDMSIDEKYVNSSYYIGDKGIAQSLCDLLNELTEENEELKIAKQNWYRQDSKIRVKLHQLKEENEQLKEENKELRQYLDWQDMELEEMEDLE